MIKFKGEKEVPEHSGKDAKLTLNKPSSEMLVMLILKAYDNLASNEQGFRDIGATDVADILARQAEWAKAVMTALRDGTEFNTNLYTTEEEMTDEMERSTKGAARAMRADPELREVQEGIMTQLRDMAGDNPEMLEELRKFEESIGVEPTKPSKRSYH